MTNSELTIGALTRHNDVAKSQFVKDKIPGLAKLAGLIGDPQVRSRGTLGGSLQIMTQQQTTQQQL
jgi:carbon-monoxide dehydrogenase medium subunit